MIENDLTPQERSELGDLTPLYERLEKYEVPMPDSAKLLAALKPLVKVEAETAGGLNPRLDKGASPLNRLPIAASVEVGFEADERTTQASSLQMSTNGRRNSGQALRDWLRLVSMQASLLEAPFWWSSLLITGIGLALGVSLGSVTTMTFLMFLSPLIAVGGVAYIFRPATHTLWELEQFSRFRPFEVLYARLALILSFNTLLASSLLLVAWTQGAQIVLWRLLLMWFGPMIGLTGLALFCSVQWGTLAGLAAPIVAWGMLIAAGWQHVLMNLRFDMPNLAELITLTDTSNTVLLIAVAALIGGILLVLESGRRVTQWR